MKTKPKIKEIIIVEGKTDSAKLKKLFDVETFETNGSSLNKTKISFIKKLSESRGIILFFDPDETGEKIRKILVSNIPNTKNCFLDKNTSFKNNKSSKKGLAEADDIEIIKAIENVAIFNNHNKSMTWEEYLSLELDNQEKRNHLTNFLNISNCNNKQLFKRLNMLNIDKKKCLKIIKG